MRRARTYRWTRMRPYRARFRGQGVFFAFQSWAGCTTNIFGFDLRQAQAAFLGYLGQLEEWKSPRGNALCDDKTKEDPRGWLFNVCQTLETIKRIETPATPIASEA